MRNKTKTISVADGIKLDISQYPNFHKSGSIIGMKRKYYGLGATLVRCGSYVYNVPYEVWERL